MTDRSTEMYRSRHDVLSTDIGEGPTIVFSHGTLMDRTMFNPQIEALSDDYRTVAYDSRARTDRWRGPYDLDDLVLDCRALLKAKDIDSCVLAGMSMGGFMALRFALQHQDLLDGLILIDSMAEKHTGEEHEQYGMMLDQIEGEYEIPTSLAGVSADLLFGSTTNEEKPDLVESWINRWKTYPGDAVVHEVNSWLGRPDVTPRLTEIDVPALVIHGKEDAAIHPDRAEPMAEGLDAHMETVPEAGHSSNLENPEYVNREIRSFLEELT